MAVDPAWAMALAATGVNNVDVVGLNARCAPKGFQIRHKIDREAERPLYFLNGHRLGFK